MVSVGGIDLILLVVRRRYNARRPVLHDTEACVKSSVLRKELRFKNTSRQFISRGSRSHMEPKDSWVVNEKWEKFDDKVNTFIVTVNGAACKCRVS